MASVRTYRLCVFTCVPFLFKCAQLLCADHVPDVLMRIASIYVFADPFLVPLLYLITVCLQVQNDTDGMLVKKLVKFTQSHVLDPFPVEAPVERAEVVCPEPVPGSSPLSCHIRQRSLLVFFTKLQCSVCRALA